MQQTLYKYELTPLVAEYLLRAVNSQQVRGEQGAQDLLAVANLLKNPVNKEELEKETLEKLQEKYQPVTEQEEKKD